MITFTNLCLICDHLITGGDDGERTCAAYPDGNGIPVEIWDEAADHRSYQPGDNGVRFTPNPDKSQESIDRYIARYEDSRAYKESNQPING
jgi:hypothetical protein